MFYTKLESLSAEPFIFRTWNDNLYGEFLENVSKSNEDVIRVQCAILLKPENVTAIRYPGIMGKIETR